MWPTVPPDHPGGFSDFKSQPALPILGSSFHKYLLKAYYVSGPVPGDASGSSQTPASKAAHCLL